MREDGMFLPCREHLAPTTSIRLQLLYANGALAIEGRGTVVRYDVRPMPGLELALTWSEASLPLVAWCRSRSRPTRPNEVESGILPDPAAAPAPRPSAPSPPEPALAGLLPPPGTTSGRPVDPLALVADLLEPELVDSELTPTPTPTAEPVPAPPTGPGPKVPQAKRAASAASEDGWAGFAGPGPKVPIAIVGAQWIDEDEPLTDEPAPPGYEPSPAVAMLEDEPLSTGDPPAGVGPPWAPEAPSFPADEAHDASAAMTMVEPDPADLASPAGLQDPWKEELPSHLDALVAATGANGAHGADAPEPSSPWSRGAFKTPSQLTPSRRTPDPYEWDDESPPPEKSGEDFDLVLLEPEDRAPSTPERGLIDPDDDEEITEVGPRPTPAPSRPRPISVIIGAPVDASTLQPVGEGADPEALPKSVVELEEVIDLPQPAAGSPHHVPSIPPVQRLTAVDREREPGEVTPLARIALVRRRVDTADLPGSAVPPTAIPSKRHRPPLPPPSRQVVGVDMGTATTAMAALVRGQLQLLPSRTGTRVIPSVVLIEGSGKTFVGEGAARRLPWRPRLGIAGPVRLLGRVAESPQARWWEAETSCELGTGDDGEVTAVLGAHVVSIEEVVALLLKEVRQSTTLALGEAVNRAVLTCPSFFGARQRQALRLAGELAGFHVERVVSAPLAAAVDLTKGRIRPSRVMIVDCGAGALDVALVEVTPEGYELVAARGSRELGGDAYDQLLVRHLATVTNGLDGASSLGGFFDIREAAELGKWTLSEQETAHIDVARAPRADGEDHDDGDEWELHAEIRRTEAEALFEPLVSRSIALIQSLCEEANWAPESLDNVVPVGGQARIPLLLSSLREVFSGAITRLDPQTTVPFGAARIAERIAEGRPLGLREVVPSTLSIGGDRGRLHPVLARGRRLPAVEVRPVPVANESDLEVFIFEGEGEHATQVEPLHRLTLASGGEPLPMPCTVHLTIEMSEEGMLRYEVVEPVSGRSLAPTINPDLSPSALRAHLHLADEAKRGADEGSVFAWLLKRLRVAETDRGVQRQGS